MWSREYKSLSLFLTWCWLLNKIQSTGVCANNVQRGSMAKLRRLVEFNWPSFWIGTNWKPLIGAILILSPINFENKVLYKHLRFFIYRLNTDFRANIEMLCWTKNHGHVNMLGNCNLLLLFQKLSGERELCNNIMWFGFYEELLIHSCDLFSRLQFENDRCTVCLLTTTWHCALSRKSEVTTDQSMREWRHPQSQ